jgi:hypothetical protein
MPCRGLGMDDIKKKYTWADLNLKLSECFSGIIGDMRELFNTVAHLQMENNKLNEECNSLKTEITKLRNSKGVKNVRPNK